MESNDCSFLILLRSNGFDLSHHQEHRENFVVEYEIKSV